MSSAMKVLMLVSVLMPLAYLVLVPVSSARPVLRWGLPLLPLPALALALVSGGGWSWSMAWVMPDGLWLMDDVRRVFLLLTALLWACAGVVAAGYLGEAHLRRFVVCWSLTLAGNLGLTLAGDVGSFYSFFALMTFASYGLVVHEGTAEALRAGRVYLVMAIIGEMLLLAGLLVAAAAADSARLADLPPAVAQAEHRHVIIGLLLTGFGVKAGLPLLHFWLPLAHPVAPTPASAVLSGAMIKAGLLGWLLTLPLGYEGLTLWGDGLVVAGALATLGGALIGVCQGQAKAVLAYSSISQMGLITLLVGAALGTAGYAEAILPVVALYALHHGLAKGALFLSAAVVLPAGRGARALVWVLIALPGFALAGLPLTSGALAKLAMKHALKPDHLALATAPYLPKLMSAGAVATLLLVLRFLWLQAGHARTGRGPVAVTVGWGLAVASSLILFWWLPWQTGGQVNPPYWLATAHQFVSLLWPILLALVIGGLVAKLVPRAPAVPPGDALVGLEKAGAWLASALSLPPFPRLRAPGSLARWWQGIPVRSDLVEQGLRAAPILVLLVLVVTMAMLV